MSEKRPGNSYFIAFNAMEKKHIIKFLNGKKRGAYKLLVEMYSEEVTSMPMTLALEIIREDLGRESGEMVDLNYNSLARAVARSKKKSRPRMKWEYENGISRTRMNLRIAEQLQENSKSTE
jgi:hypothetical protein